MAKEVTPFIDGKATHTDKKHMEATFALSEEMKGWKMIGADVDPTGYFITIRWEKTNG